MWKNIVEPGRLLRTIWRMRIACWIPKATNTLSEYVINYCFYAVTMVALTRLNFTLYVHCLTYFVKNIETLNMIPILFKGEAWEVLTLWKGKAFYCFLEAQRRTALLICCYLQSSNSWQCVPSHYWALPQRRHRSLRRNIRSASNTLRSQIALRVRQPTGNVHSTYKRNIEARSLWHLLP